MQIEPINEKNVEGRPRLFSQICRLWNNKSIQIVYKPLVPRENRIGLPRKRRVEYEKKQIKQK